MLLLVSRTASVTHTSFLEYYQYNIMLVRVAGFGRNPCEENDKIVSVTL